MAHRKEEWNGFHTNITDQAPGWGNPQIVNTYEVAPGNTIATEMSEVLEALIRRIGQAQEERRATGMTCPVVLTPNEERVLSLGDHHPGNDLPGVVPSYQRQGRSLYWKGACIKVVAGNARLQQLVLEVFEEENWGNQIDDPLPPKQGMNGAARLRETVRCLNKGLKPGTIRFFSDGTGKGICWKVVEEQPRAEKKPRKHETHASHMDCEVGKAVK
jgi:hypothetical protein